MSNEKQVETDKNTLRKLIDNARNLALGPELELNELKDEPHMRYFTSYEGDKIAVKEKTDGQPVRTISIFPPTKDGKIAADRVCDWMNSDDGKISVDESLSFETAQQQSQERVSIKEGQSVRSNDSLFATSDKNPFAR